MNESQAKWHLLWMLYKLGVTEKYASLLPLQHKEPRDDER